MCGYYQCQACTVTLLLFSQVLFLIPKNPPPTLEGNFSKQFREFVSLCLQRDPKDVRAFFYSTGNILLTRPPLPNQRPSAKDLLKHKFVRLAKKSNYLTELIERHERWKAEGGQREQEEDRDYDDDSCVIPVPYFDYPAKL
jgi:serine/threonine-protein kinase 24/25/MST4